MRSAKLRAIANDPAASEGERRTAERLLSQLRERGVSDEIVVAMHESWETALMISLAERHNTTITFQVDTLTLSGKGVDAVFKDLLTLYPRLEAMIVATTAGFLAAEFPMMRAGAASSASDVSDLALAAYKAALPERKLLT